MRAAHGCMIQGRPWRDLTHAIAQPALMKIDPPEISTPFSFPAPVEPGDTGCTIHVTL